jgi:exodeoxyribonuclease-5
MKIPNLPPHMNPAAAAPKLPAPTGGWGVAAALGAPKPAPRGAASLCYPEDPEWQSAEPPTGFDPSEDQRAALNALLIAATPDRANGSYRKPLVLVGPAGSGKTTIMRWVANTFRKNGWSIKFLAPTGKAAARISEVVGDDASTIHAALYGKFTNNGKTLIFGDPHLLCDAGTLLVCDEASMVDGKIAAEMLQWLPPNALLLYVGDREQLPPVNGTWGADLLNPTAHLDTVHRQAAENPILALATSIRTNAAFDWSAVAADQRLSCIAGSVNSVVDWCVQALDNGRDATAICYTNTVRQRINVGVRAARGFKAPIEVGDLMLIRQNNKNIGVMNGEVYTVETATFTQYHPSLPDFWDVKFRGVDRHVLIIQGLIGSLQKNEFFEAIKALPRKEAARVVRFPSQRILDITHVDYGYALTAHSSQGSQWKEVLLYAEPAVDRMRRDRPDEGRRWLYTAVTRASEKLIWTIGGGT